MPRLAMMTRREDAEEIEATDASNVLLDFSSLKATVANGITGKNVRVRIFNLPYS